MIELKGEIIAKNFTPPVPRRFIPYIKSMLAHSLFVTEDVDSFQTPGTWLKSKFIDLPLHVQLLQRLLILSGLTVTIVAI